jgi:flagellar hook-associated protein 3 FlgL
MTSSVTNSNSLLMYLRPTMLNLQSKLISAQEEATTGRQADIGLHLGYQTGRTVSLRLQLDQLASLTQTNTGVTATLDASKTALDGLTTTGQSFLNALIFAQSNGSGSAQAAVQSQAQASLQSFTDTLNTSYGGSYIFAGDNTAVPPVASYAQTPPSAAQTAIADAFQTAFGMSQVNADVVNIQPEEMQNFLGSAFADLFTLPSWQANWTVASSQNLRFQISPSQTIDLPANANDQPYRDLAAAYAMVADLGTANLNQSTFQTLLGQAIQLTQKGLQGIADIQASIGVNQQTLTTVTATNSAQTTVLTCDINSLEAVDPSTAAATLNETMTQLETAYSLSGHLQHLSLLNYI